MIFALDYDDTYTETPDLWRQFVANARQQGHYVMCVTARHSSEPVGDPGVFDEVIYCGGVRKAEFLRQEGVPSPNVWIDDSPWTIGE